jgi:mRNA-degrading endonuclease RelE of RelBE toxin-antitoxin system
MRKRLIDALDDAARDFESNSKGLTGLEERSIRVGQLRMLVLAYPENHTILVSSIRPRGDVYKHARK